MSAQHTPAPWVNGAKVSIIFQNPVSGAEWWGVYSGLELLALVKEPEQARLVAAAPALAAFAEVAEGVIAWAADHGADTSSMLALEKMRRDALALAGEG